MKLIADSGSTKTDWCLFDDEEKVKSRLASQGINPFHMSEDTILDILRNELLPQLDSVRSSIEEIEFYGAGCTVAKIPVMKALLSEVFPSAKSVVVGSDMLVLRRLCLAKMRVLRVFSVLVPIRVCMMARRLSIMSHQWGIFLVMKVVVRYLARPS